MKRIRYIMFLIITWCIGISNIERVGNLAEVHAAQPTPKDLYDNACNVLDQLNQNHVVSTTDLQAAIDNLLKAIVPGKTDLKTTSNSPDKLKAGLKSAICAYELLDALDWNASQVVRFILSPSSKLAGNKTRSSVERGLAQTSKDFINTVHRTFVTHISKHWLTNLKDFKPAEHAETSGFVFAQPTTTVKVSSLAQYAIDTFIEGDVNWLYELGTYDKVLCLEFKLSPKISYTKTQVRMPAFDFETYYCSFSDSNGRSMLNEHISNGDDIKTLLGKQNPPYSIEKCPKGKEYKREVEVFLRLAHEHGVRNNDGRFGSFYYLTS